MTRPTRKYLVQTGPVLVPKDNGAYEIASDACSHAVFGTHLKYDQGKDGMGFIHILNNHGDVVFACPTTMILWVHAEQGEWIRKPTDVHAIHITEKADEPA